MPSAKRKCGGHRKDGSPCRGDAVKGTDPPRCRMHGGNQQKDRELRAAVSEWKLGDPTLDPVAVMLATVTVSWYRLAEAQEAYDQAIAALGYDPATVGDAYGEGGKTGEYIRGLAHNVDVWFQNTLNASAKAVTAGLAERQVRIVEQQAEVIGNLLRSALTEAGLGDRVQEVLGNVGRRLRALPGGSARPA